MKRSLLILALLPFLCESCYLARIVTTTPNAVPVATVTSAAPVSTVLASSGHGYYSTTVTVPRTRVVTTSTRVIPTTDDISLYLDLQAVGAAFAQSSTVQQFENLLNNSSYMLSNLDLNGDGYVDYLRVIETVQGSAHMFVIQACLADNVYQDVATLVAEVPSYASYHVQVIGSPYIYGPNYIVEPVFVARPLIFTHLLSAAYRAWVSPWRWGYFPSYYRRPAILMVDHYHAYVHTFVVNHRYCREIVYASSCHYPAYTTVCQSVMRNDYGRMYPERSFTVRNANTPVTGTSTRVTNARDVRNNYNTSVRASTTSTRSAGATSTRSTVTTPSTARTTKPATSSTTRTGTTVRSRVSASGSSNTRISTTSSSGVQTTTRRSSGSARTSTAPARSAASGSTRSGAASSTRSGSTSSARSGSTSSRR